MLLGLEAELNLTSKPYTGIVWPKPSFLTRMRNEWSKNDTQAEPGGGGVRRKPILHFGSYFSFHILEVDNIIRQPYIQNKKNVRFAGGGRRCAWLADG